MNRKVVFCDCGSPEHQLVFDEDSYGGKVYGLNIYYQIKKMTFLEKLKFLFNRNFNRNYYGEVMSDVIVNDVEKITDLRNFLTEMIDKKIESDTK